MPRARILLALALWIPAAVHAQAPEAAPPADTLYASDAFVVTDRAVYEGPHAAVAVSAEELRSTFVYDVARTPRRLAFKFALMGRDNEALPGTDRILYLTPEDGRLVTPVYTFGAVAAENAGVTEPPALDRPVQEAFDVTFRLDLRAVLAALRETGVYTPPAGESITAEAFFDDDAPVYVIGAENPLSWDLNALTDAHRLTDPDGDGLYETTLSFEVGGTRPFVAEGAGGYARWRPDPGIDVGAYPVYRSDQPLVDALYRLSLEELRQDVRPDGAFMAGAKWTGVWTRDISYSILLALAFADPEASRASLLAKTRDGVIIQDTGTGGSWPVSTDRMTWALAAWEVYRVIGDRAWLRTAYDHVRRSAEADLHAARDPETGLFYGESSFLDWREQTYPRWMDPRDIYVSQTLGTNAVHHATYRILAQMATLLGEDAAAVARWTRVADEVRDAMNATLWQSDRGTYGQYLYGRPHVSLSPKAEALGAALTVLQGIATEAQTRRMLAAFPMVPYGVPSIAPQIAGIPPYHNDGVWPFVVAYMAWAGAEGRNAAVVEHTLASLYRAAGLFLTNKENLVATTGHFQGTQINSDRQLWSVAGTLATVYRVLFGMRFEVGGEQGGGGDRLVFRPFVPAAYDGVRRLEGVRWRGAVLDVELRGHGAAVAEATLDGAPLPVEDGAAAVPATLAGRHALVLTLDGRVPPSRATVRPVDVAPETPDVRLADAALAWAPVADAVAYEVLRDGDLTATTTATAWTPPDGADADVRTTWQVRAVGADGDRSFLSAPVYTDGWSATAEPGGPLATDEAGYAGDGYLRLTTDAHTEVTVTVDVPEAGRYLVDARYANGSGPVNTDNKGALRTLRVDGADAGVLVMPQRGAGAWDDWGYTNAVPVRLDAGPHTVTLALTPLDANMNRDVNTALLDHLRLTRVR